MPSNCIFGTTATPPGINNAFFPPPSSLLLWQWSFLRGDCLYQLGWLWLLNEATWPWLWGYQVLFSDLNTFHNMQSCEETCHKSLSYWPPHLKRGRLHVLLRWHCSTEGICYWLVHITVFKDGCCHSHPQNTRSMWAQVEADTTGERMLVQVSYWKELIISAHVGKDTSCHSLLCSSKKATHALWHLHFEHNVRWLFLVSLYKTCIT